MALTKVDISIMDNVGTTANKLLAYDGSGNLPAVDGSQLINVDTGAIVSASDPTLSTNPSGGVGSEWHNTTSGEVYICTDATAGANVWKNVGAGSGDIVPYSYMGESYGYSLGRYAYPAETNSVSMERYAFASSANGTDVGDLPTYHHSAAGLSSTTYGYACGRYNDPAGAQPAMISKVSFASGVEAGVSAGNMTSGSYGQCGVNTASYGYLAGGATNHGPYLTTTMIQQIAWASDGSTDSGQDLRRTLKGMTSHQSETYGYTCGGQYNNQGPYTNAIDKFQLATTNTSTNIATLPGGTRSNYSTSGISSSTDGYTVGGFFSPPQSINVIEKFSFTSEGSAWDVGDLATIKSSATTTSETSYGYIHSGSASPPNYAYQNDIERFAYTSGGTNVSVADIGTVVLAGNAGSAAQF